MNLNLQYKLFNINNLHNLKLQNIRLFKISSRFYSNSNLNKKNDLKNIFINNNKFKNNTYIPFIISKQNRCKNILISNFNFTTKDKENKNFNKKSDNVNELSSKNSVENMTKKDIEDIKNKKLANKLDTIFKNEMEDREKYDQERAFILKKLESINNFYKYLRYPIIAIIFPFAWINPFSAMYSYCLIFCHNYLILLTLIESSLFISAGLTSYLVNTNNYSNTTSLISLRDLRNFKRLSSGFIHFSLVLISAILGSNYSNQNGLLLLFLANAYLYTKYCYHIHLNILPKEYFNERMFYIFFNAVWCILLIIIISWKSNLYKMIV